MLRNRYHFASLESQLVFLHDVDSNFLREKCFAAIVLNSRADVQISSRNDSSLQVSTYFKNPAAVPLS